MTATEREFVNAVSDVTDSIDDSQNYISQESIPADAVIELLRGIRDRLECTVENLIGD